VKIESLRDHLCDMYPDLCPLFSIEFGDGTLVVPADRLHGAAADLKELGFSRLSMVTAVDNGEVFTLVYRLKSRTLEAGIFLKADVPREDPRIDSVFDLWPAADWQEREVFDLFGITFTGHPNLCRILLPDDWQGHPLRKDYADANIIKRPDYI
jgi:NADH-quinone oxidoreductase subunit C